MSAFRCDLHIHSCLSPCGDDDMTPHSIAGMAKVCGLQIAALTDHNTCGNCEAFFRAAEGCGVIPVAGMELTTSEEIHLLCLFRSLEDALAFSNEVEKKRMRVMNRAEVFGRQIRMNERDETTGEEPDLLVTATALSLEEGAALVKRFRGAPVPAHIDREANGLIAVLGALPERPAFAAVEFRDESSAPALEREHPALKGKRRIVSSDAHRLTEIAEPGWSVELPVAADANGVTTRNALIDWLLGA